MENARFSRILGFFFDTEFARDRAGVIGVVGVFGVGDGAATAAAAAAAWTLTSIFDCDRAAESSLSPTAVGVTNPPSPAVAAPSPAPPRIPAVSPPPFPVSIVFIRFALGARAASNTALRFAALTSGTVTAASDERQTFPGIAVGRVVVSRGGGGGGGGYVRERLLAVVLSPDGGWSRELTL